MEWGEKTAHFSFNAATNLEVGEERYKVSEELLLDHPVLHFGNESLLWFLETSDSLGTSTARMPPEAPC